MNTYQRTFFTLVELMVVMVLIGMLLTVSFPLYSNYIIGDGVSREARALKQELVFCRDYSRHFQCYTAVFFPDHRVLGEGHAEGGRCYRSAVLIRKNKTLHFLRWVNDSAWKFAKKGVYIELESGGQVIDLATNDVEPYLVDKPAIGDGSSSTMNHIYRAYNRDNPLEGLVKNINDSECRCVVFTPRGKPYSSGLKIPLLRVGLGYWQNGDQHITNVDDYLEVTIDRESGRVSYER